MKKYVGSLLLLLLLTAAVLSGTSYEALAREPVPAREYLINTSFADPGEDPHLNIKVEPAPVTGQSGSSCGASGGERPLDDNVVHLRNCFRDKLDLLLHSVYKTVNIILF